MGFILSFLLFIAVAGAAPNDKGGIIFSAILVLPISVFIWRVNYSLINQEDRELLNESISPNPYGDDDFLTH